MSRRAGIVIREADVSDAVSLARLATQLGYPTTEEEAGRRAAAIFGRADHRVLIAVAGGDGVGWIHVAPSVTLESDPSAEVAGLVVDDRYRGQGIGARLLAEAEAWATAQGYALMRVRSNVKRNRARRFYERAGFVVTKRQRNFEKRLEGSPAPE
ncbi:MAG TPA: GNAT family N-acetyltransferase [Gemmatimonadota bacterium]|nr:GNAT family N-acetyltransferase [Gemmatimonadota bacterium]